MKNIFRSHSLAAACLAAICIVAFGALTADRGSAFTQVERQFAFNPVEITLGQTAHVVFNNTFGAQEIHVTINWSDAVSGAPIGSPFQADVKPGQGVIALLPAVQTPPSTNGGGSRAIIAVLAISAAPGSLAPSILVRSQLTGALEVIDVATGHVNFTNGFGLIPAVQ